jgi:hypothetical protein
MERAPLPSEAAELDRIFAGSDLPDPRVWRELEDAEETPGYDPCKEIEKLCGEYRSLADERVGKLWTLLRMPFAPASIASGLAAVAAAAKIIPHEVAYSVTGVSACYSGWKGINFLADRSAILASMQAAVTKIRLFLPEVCERDLLLVRSMLDEFPEVREGCSDW